MKVMISSTIEDLSLIRDRLIELINRLGGAPIACEFWGASLQTTAEKSRQSAHECEMLVLIVGDRYGSIPPGESKSYTQIEFDIALQRGIPILAYIKEKPASADADQMRQREAFVSHVSKTIPNTWGTFKDVVDIAIDLPMKLQEQFDSRKFFTRRADKRPRIVHPYSLMHTALFGREKQIADLDAWSQDDAMTIGVIDDIGGMGKSALCYEWWQGQFPREAPDRIWQGGFWYSFYASSDYQTMMRELYSYIEGASAEAAMALPLAKLEEGILSALEEHRILIAFDGFETTLEAYRTFEDSIESLGEAKSHDKRQFHEQAFAKFLAKLVQRKRCRSKILVTTRMFPLEFEGSLGKPMPGIERWSLPGIDIAGARKYWSACSLDPADPNLETFVTSIGGYPLALSLMAATMKRQGCLRVEEVHGYQNILRPGNTHDTARRDVFAGALSALSSIERRTLLYVASFRRPASPRVLRDILVKKDGDTGRSRFFRTDTLEFDTPEDLIDVLQRLQELHFIGLDEAARTYDMHPIMRGLLNERVEANELQSAQSDVLVKLQTVPRGPSVRSLADLEVPLELFSLRAKQGLYEEATIQFLLEDLSKNLEKLNEKRLKREGLEELIEVRKSGEVVSAAARWRSTESALARAAQGDTAMALANCYADEGRWSLALSLFDLHRDSGFCKDPLCDTMRTTCLKALGRFGDAESTFQDCSKHTHAFSKAAFSYTREELNVVGRPNVDEYFKEIRAYANHRLAELHLQRALDTRNAKSARLAIVRKLKVLEKTSLKIVDNGKTKSQYAREHALKIADLARVEGQHRAALDMSRLVHADAEKDADFNDRNRAQLSLAKSHFDANDFAGALAAYSRHWDELDRDQGQPQGAQILTRLAECRIGLGQPNEAERLVEDCEHRLQAWDDRQADTLVLMTRSKLHRVRHEDDKEKAALLQLVRIHAKNRGSPRNDGELPKALKRLQEFSGAKAELRELMARLGPGIADTYLQINPFGEFHAWTDGGGFTYSEALKAVDFGGGDDSPVRSRQARR